MKPLTVRSKITSCDDVRYQLRLQMVDGVFQLEFTLFQALHLQLIEGNLFAQVGDYIIQVPMLCLEFD